MNNLNSLKDKGKESFSNPVQLGKEQPEKVQTWGITGGAALIGALALTAVAKGLLGIIATLASPPVSLTVGALSGGVLGWSYFQQQKQAAGTEDASSAVASTATTAFSDEPAVAANG